MRRSRRSSSASRMAADLAVHHPGGRDDVGAGLGLGQRRPGRRARGWRRCRPRRRRSSTPQWPWSVYSSRQRSAMSTSRSPMVVAQVAQGELHDAVGVPGARALGVLALGDAEEDHRRDAEVGELGHLLAQRLAGVLHHAGQRARSAGARRCPPARTAGRSRSSTPRRVSATSRRSAGVRRSRRRRRWGKVTARSYPHPPGAVRPGPRRRWGRGRSPGRLGLDAGGRLAQGGEVVEGQADQRLDPQIGAGEIAQRGEAVGHDHAAHAGRPGGGGAVGGVLERHRLSRVHPERGARRQEQVGRGLGPGDVVAGPHDVEPGAQAEALEVAARPRTVATTTPRPVPRPAASGPLEEVDDAGQRRRGRPAARCSRARRGAVTASRSTARPRSALEVAQPVDVPGRADHVDPVLRREGEAVQLELLGDRAVLGPLGVGDQAVEVEDEPPAAGHRRLPG